MSNHPFAHIELSSKDRRKSAQFYSSVFGWETQDFDEMNYTTFSTGGDGPGGGFNPVTDENPAGSVMVYIQADDLEGTLRKIESAGGKVVLREMEVPGQGWMSIFQDLDGNTISLWKNLPQE